MNTLELWSFLDNLYIVNLSYLIVMSLFLNYLLLIAIKLGYLGLNLKTQFNELLQTPSKLNSMTFTIFVIYFIISLYWYNGIIFLDDNVVVTAKIENSTFSISGEALNILFNHLGNVAVFTIGARIAATLVAKSKIGLLPKIGTVTGTGAGFSLTYKIINKAIPNGAAGDKPLSVETGPIEIKLDNLDLKKDYLYNNTIFKTNSDLNLNERLVDGTRTIEGGNEVTNKVLQELDSHNINWRDNFTVNSPLEPTNSANEFIKDILNDNLMLKYIIVYLLIMLIIVLICRLNVSSNINTTALNKYALAGYINRLLNKYISVWQKSSTLWIYFILISVIIFNIASIISISRLVSIL